jgi:ribose transport system substrate-binding protein
VSEREDRALGRRGFLFGSAAVAGGAILAGCTGQSSSSKAAGSANVAKTGGSNSTAGKHVTIGFSAPAADHGWIGAITKNAHAQAATFSDVTLQATEGTNDVNQQISQVQTLIDKKVDILVILPYDGKALTAIAEQAMKQGIPVVNLDRVFASDLAYRAWIGGDNYGMGINAGNYIASRLAQSGKKNPVIVEIAGLDILELTQQRSKGFKEALASHGLKVTARQAADFTADGGQRVAANLLQAQPHIDAIWNHDDDQGIGVEAAIKQASRKEFFMVGGAGSKRVMEEIKAGTGPIEATVLYPPTMASSAISLARLIVQNRGMSDLIEREVPKSITTYSAVVTKDNVDTYLPNSFV